MSETAIRRFTILHNDLWSSNLITVREKEILATLKTYCNKKNACFPSVREIANRIGCCMRKVRYVLKSLKEKCLIKIETQYRKDNSQMSNFYTVYDFPEVWSAENIEDIPGIVEECLEKQRREAIEKLKAEIAPASTPVDNPNAQVKPTASTPIQDIKTKEKEIDINIALPPNGSNKNQSLPKNSCTSNYSTRINRSQEKKEKFVETYSMNFLKEYFDYDVILSYPRVSERELEAVFNIIYDTVNTGKSEVRISSQDMPAQIVISKLLKLDCDDIMYAITKYKEQTGRIYNQRAYILTLLYRAKEQYQVDITNQVNYDMAHIDWEEFHDKQQELQEKQQEENTTTSNDTDWDKLLREKAERNSKKAEQAQEQAKYVQKQQEQDTSNKSSLYDDFFKKIRGHKRE